MKNGKRDTSLELRCRMTPVSLEEAGVIIGWNRQENFQGGGCEEVSFAWVHQTLGSITVGVQQLREWSGQNYRLADSGEKRLGRLLITGTTL